MSRGGRVRWELGRALLDAPPVENICECELGQLDVCEYGMCEPHLCMSQSHDDQEMMHAPITHTYIHTIAEQSNGCRSVVQRQATKFAVGVKVTCLKPFQI